MLLITDPAVDFCVLVFSKSFSSMCAINCNGTVEPVDGDPTVADADARMGHWDYAVSVRYSGARSKTMIRLLYEK